MKTNAVFIPVNKIMHSPQVGPHPKWNQIEKFLKYEFLLTDRKHSTW